MSVIADLENFPFKSMEEFNSAFKNGIAEPVIPREFAKKWVNESGDSTVKKQFIFFDKLIPTLLIGLSIWLTISKESLKWYHCIIALFIGALCFSPNLNRTFRNVVSVIVLGITVYFYFAKVEFANLLVMTFCMVISFKAADYFLFKDSIRHILKDEQLAIKLWDHEIMAIRYQNGSVVFKTKKIN